MTAPTEPLVTSLEEAMQHLAASKMWLESLSPQQWVVYAWDDVLDEPTGVALGSTWWEAVSEALNRPVIARDPTAELRAAAEKSVTAFDEWMSADRAYRYEAQQAYFRSVGTLRAVLAATEGEEA